MRFAVCRCLRWLVRSSSKIRSMIPVNGPSFGRLGGALRRYPGGTENDSILRTVLRSTPNTREASRVLIPSTRHARRTRAYNSTRYIPPPSSQSNPDRRLYAVPFWSAAAGSTGRFSGGLLLCRSHPPPASLARLDGPVVALPGSGVVKAGPDWNVPVALLERLERPSLPIRLTPMTAACRVPPLSRVKLGIGWRQRCRPRCRAMSGRR